MREESLGALKSMTGQERVDALIELAYSDRRQDLRPDDYWKLGFPETSVEQALTDAASMNDAFSWPKGIVPDSQARWRCEIAGKLFRAEDYPPDEAIEILADEIAPRRKAEILCGAPLTEDEWLMLEEIEEGGFTDVFLYRCEDVRARGLTFAAIRGDWGETLRTYGPFLDHEEALRAIVGPGDLLLLDDSPWVASTPECGAPPRP